MSEIVIFLSGVFVGIACMWLVQLAAHHNVHRSHEFESLYGPARRVALHELHAHGTLNVKQFERLLDATAPLAFHFLEKKVTDNLLVRHKHQGGAPFYTLVTR